MVTADPIAGRVGLPPVEAHLHDAQQELDDLVARTGMPGAQLGLSDGERIWTLCSGVADMSTGRPVTPATRFSFASLTKYITATMAMTLVDEGRLDLHAPPSEYLPGLQLPRWRQQSDDRRHVTVGDLLSHCSGLGGFFAAEDDESAEQAVRRLAETLVPFAAPGRTYSLCNAAYLVGAACLDRLTGLDWHQAIVERILAPTGATLATTDRGLAAGPGTARGHLPSRTGERLVLPVPFGPPALDATAGIFGTVSDALAVARDHLRSNNAQGRLLSAAAAHELNRLRVAIPDPYWDGSSLGWLNSNWGTSILDARGADAGQETVLRIAPANGRGLALFTNGWTRRWPYFDVLPRTSELLLGAAPPPVPALSGEPVGGGGQPAPDIAGTYLWDNVAFDVTSGASGPRLSTRNRGVRGGLFVQLTDVPLTRLSRDVYAFPMPNVELPLGMGFSEPDGEGRPQLAHLLQRTARRTA